MHKNIEIIVLSKKDTRKSLKTFLFGKKAFISMFIGQISTGMIFWGDACPASLFE